MKKQEIARENIFSSVGRVTVAVYLKADTDKQTLSTVLFSNKSKFVPGPIVPAVAGRWRNPSKTLLPARLQSMRQPAVRSGSI